jgi:pimeloyl-ACP methyl ester carboxylesterase
MSAVAASAAPHPQWIETPRGVRCRVFETGQGPPLVFLHGASGLLAENGFLEELAGSYRVLAPEWPAFGESTGEDLLDDMLDFALHGWDVIEALDLQRPHLVGHSMGGMIAAEMACVAPRQLGKLVLVAPAGLWLDAHPIPDLFAFQPHEFAPMLFHDSARGAALLTGGVDVDSREAVKQFYIAHSKRLAMAGKILFPIPNRGVAKRLYRMRAETLVLWGANDRLIPPVYAERWAGLIRGAKVAVVDDAGHMVPWEQPERFVSAVRGFLG